MKLQLILADHCATCTETERVWRNACRELDLEFHVLSTREPDGAEIAAQLNLNTFPALLVDGRIRAIGAPSDQTARDTLRNLLQAPPGMRP